MRRAIHLGAATILLLGGAVGAAEPGAPSTDKRPEAGSDMARPWMVSEAKLPSGFPAPGPVDEVIVKTYPAHRLARANAAKGANGMFMKLFRHIERNEIAMTAPVVMGWPEAAAGDDGAGSGRAARAPDSMAFLYGKPTLGAPGVDPADPLVVVEDVPEMVVASIGLRGGYDQATMDRGVERLQAWLKEHPEWKAAGPPRSLAYNSPFIPGFAKYSEVQVPVEREP